MSETFGFPKVKSKNVFLKNSLNQVIKQKTDPNSELVQTFGKNHHTTINELKRVATSNTSFNETVLFRKLKGKSSRTVLSEIFEESLTNDEISKRTGISIGRTFNILKTLENDRIIRSNYDGKRKFYSIIDADFVRMVLLKYYPSMLV